MKAKKFTLAICVLFGVSFTAFSQDISTGINWGTTAPTEPLVLNENFQGFKFFHNDENPDQGNSDNKIDPISGEPVYGFKNMTSKAVIVGKKDSAITYTFEQCAFAPAWKTAYAYKNETENTKNVSNGFVEISRNYAASGGNLPTIRGYFIVDLRKIEFVDVVQWSHSSTGGNKRGVMCEFSVDNAKTWDTLRYQPGTAWAASFTKDVFTKVKTPNSFRCDPSAYGMTWEDGIWAENVMLRFSECGGQTARIHDLKVYGSYTPVTSVSTVKNDDLRIFSSNRIIRISEPAKVAVYSLTGNLVKTAEQTNSLSMTGVPAGIYLVKAMVDNRVKTSKIIVK